MLNSVHAVIPSMVAAAGSLGRDHDEEHIAVGLDRHILGHHILDRHIHEEAEAARRTAVDTVVGRSGPGSGQRNGQNDLVMIQHGTERGMRHSLHTRSPPELVVNSAKGELGNWTYSWRTDYHHAPPESSSLES